MTFPLSFHVPAEPQSAQRPRHGKGGHTYTPPETHAAQALIAWHFRRAYPRHQPVDRLALRMVLVLTRYERQVRDVDNMNKNVLDALNKLAYRDDSQVEALCVETVWVDRQTDAGLTITLESLDRPARPPKGQG